MANEWDILSGGLGRVQNEAAGRGVRLDGKAKRVGNGINRAAKASGSADVSRALSGLKGYVTGEHHAAGSRIASSITGLGAAGRAYTDADDEMAREGQSGLGKILGMGLPPGTSSPGSPPPGHQAGPPPEGTFRIPGRSGTTDGGGE